MEEGQPTQPAPLRERLRDVHLGTVHRGVRYVFGFGSDFYGIWDEQSPDLPAERFPATREGRDEAWRRYRELEPEARSEEPPWVRAAVLGRSGPPRPWWRRRPAMSALVLVLLVGGIVFFAGGGAEEIVGTGGEPIGAEAHVEITGAVIVTDDLAQESFEGSTVGSLVPEVDATWTGPSIELGLSLVQPRTGQLRTAENPHRQLTLVVEGVGIVSVRQECTVTLDILETGGIAGSFLCSGLPAPGGEGTFDAEGTFAAEATS